MTCSRIFEMRFSMFFGGRFSRATYLPNALAMMDSLHDAPDAWTFWNGIITSIHRLHDWHTTVSAPVGYRRSRALIPVCFVEGDADLSHASVAEGSELLRRARLARRPREHDLATG